ncbi:MAG: immunoglobulin domain-containing protein [Verrucomicrobia bacterium]|nr:immunoglobulin domain-containing protein [Verrucomicrobiota bacterium]
MQPIRRLVSQGAALCAAFALHLHAAARANGSVVPLDLDDFDPPPVISAHPQSVTITEGLRASFSVTAVGSDLGYQWFKDSALMTGAIGSVLLFPNVTPGQAGTYAVVITNSLGGAVTSNPALLTVLPRPATLDLTDRLVGHYPFDGNFNDAWTNAFHGAAVGTPGFGTGKVGAGALRVTTAQNGSSFNYVTLGTAPMPFLTESDFTVSFWVKYSNYVGDPPFLSNKDWNSGNNVGLVIADSGGGGVAKHNIRASGGSRVDGNIGRTGDGLWHHVVAVYQRAGVNSNATLYLDGYPVATNSLVNLVGSIDSSLPVNIGQDGTGTYTYGHSVGLTNALIDDVALWGRSLVKSEVEFVFLEGRDGRSFDGIRDFAPLILVPPQSTNLPYQGTLTLSVEAGGTPPLTYQWFRDVDALPDQTNATLVIPSVGENDWGPYHVEVSNPVGGPVFSPECWVNVLFSVPPPVIGQSPGSVTTNRSLDVTFTVTATGDFLRYQWRRDGSNIPSATNDLLILRTVSPAEAGTYTVVVTNFGGAVTSAPAVLTVVSERPVLVTGQWDFQNGDLGPSCGLPLGFGDAGVETDTTFGTTTSFGIPPIAGSPANVMRFTPSAAKWDGYKLYHGAAPNGGGVYVNQYTLILDVLYPPSSDRQWRSLLQTATGNGNDGDFFVGTANGLGISGSYQGNLTPNEWHRLVLAVDLTVNLVTKYLDGVRVANQTLSEGRDGRWSLDPYALLIADNDGDNVPGYLSSVQFRNGKITDAEVAAMGGPTASKIPGCVSITVAGPNVLLHRTGDAQLQAADDLDGPWITVTNAPNPYQVPAPLPPKKFYRPAK